MKFLKILVAFYAFFASFAAMSIAPGGTPTSSLGSPDGDLALLGIAVAALIAAVGVIRRKK